MSDTCQRTPVQVPEPVAPVEGAGQGVGCSGPAISDRRDPLQRVRALRELVAYLEAKDRLPSHEAVLLLRLTCVMPSLASRERAVANGEVATC